MIHLLAQTTTSAASAPAGSAAAGGPAGFDYALWLPTSEALVRASLIAAGVLVVGMAVMILWRRALRHLRLGTAVMVATVALAVYMGAWGLRPMRLADPRDPIAYWLTRAFAAAMVFVALRLLDRLAVVPLLTHGGTVAMPRFVHQIVNILLALFAILIFGSRAFGWDIDRFLAGSAVVSIVLGLALQETLGNFFSGLVMQASPPFAVGDWIVCGQYEGRVTDMTWRAVTLHTLDDNFILIPNATVAKAEIVNFHAPSMSTARIVRVGLEYDLPPAEATAVLRAAALETPGVAEKPEPFIFLEEFADSAVTYAVKFWITAPSDHKKIEHAVRMNIWYRLRERGFNIPFPIRTVEHASHAYKARREHEAAGERHMAAIEQAPLLAPLSPEEKRQLAESASDVVLGPGQVLFRQNDSGDSFYVISTGQADVVVTPEGAGEERKVATLGPGEIFGEMSALTGQPRTATIRAAGEGGGATALTCMRIEKRDLLPLFEADPALMEKISEVVARRNAEREAIMQGSGTIPAAETVVRQQKSLLGRMMQFFRLGQEP